MVSKFPHNFNKHKLQTAPLPAHRKTTHKQKKTKGLSSSSSPSPSPHPNQFSLSSTRRQTPIFAARTKMLPYATIEDAAAALGRNLTFAETLWYNYSANKSDYFLYCHNILFLFLVFSVAPLPFVVIESLRSDSFDKYKIQPKVRLSFSEMVRCYKDVMRMFFLVVGPLQLVSFPSVQVFSFSLKFSKIVECVFWFLHLHCGGCFRLFSIAYPVNLLNCLIDAI